MSANPEAETIIKKALSGVRVRIGKRQLQDVIWAAKQLGAAEAEERHQLAALQPLADIFRQRAERVAERVNTGTGSEQLSARAATYYNVEALALVTSFMHLAKTDSLTPEVERQARQIEERTKREEWERLTSPPAAQPVHLRLMK